MIDKPKQPTPELPRNQECRKCGAVFRWEPSDPALNTSPLIARLVKPADNCDCGYGQVGPLNAGRS